jgi:hypothetical protein
LFDLDRRKLFEIDWTGEPSKPRDMFGPQAEYDYRTSGDDAPDRELDFIGARTFQRRYSEDGEWLLTSKGPIQALTSNQRYLFKAGKKLLGQFYFAVLQAQHEGTSALQQAKALCATWSDSEWNDLEFYCRRVYGGQSFHKMLYHKDFKNFSGSSVRELFPIMCCLHVPRLYVRAFKKAFK